MAAYLAEADGKKLTYLQNNDKLGIKIENR